jgi:hypothetical protein
MKNLPIALGLMFALAGCRVSDQEIRADIAGKAQQDLNFVGLKYTVRDGVVNFTGHCPSQMAFTKVSETVKNIHIIKAVNYRVTIAPVQLDTLTTIKLKTDSVLAQFPQATANIEPSGITLKGEVTASERTKLTETVRLLNIGIMTDSLTIR